MKLNPVSRKHFIVKFFSTRAMIIAFLAVFLLVIMSISIYSRNSRTVMIGHLKDHLEKELERSTDYIVGMYHSSVNGVESIAISLDMENDDMPESLKKIEAHSSYDFVEFVYPGGDYVNSKGKRGSHADQEYYVNGIKGKSGICVYRSAMGIENTSVLAYCPVWKDGEVCGVLAGAIHARYLSSLLSTSYSSQEVYAFLTDKTGRIITCSGIEADYPYIFAFFRDRNYVFDGKDPVTEMAMQETQDKRAFYFDKLPETEILMASPCGETGWVLYYVLTSETSSDAIKESEKPLFYLQAIIFLAMFIYVLFAAYLVANENKKVVMENIRITEEKKLAHRINESLIDHFSRVIYIDLDEDTYKLIADGETYTSAIPDEGCYSDIIRVVGEKIKEGKKSEMAEALSKEALREFYDSGEHNYLTYEYNLLHNENQWERLSVIRVDDLEGGKKAVLICMEDISDVKKESEFIRKNLQTAYDVSVSANKAKTQFLSAMSHDLRTPLNAVVVGQDLIRKHMEQVKNGDVSLDEDRVIGNLRKMKISTDCLLGLIDDILDIDKMESGEMTVNKVPFNINEIVDTVEGTLGELAREKGVALLVSVEELKHKSFVGDKGKILQIMNNLVSNAIKYTPEGGKVDVIFSEQEIGNGSHSDFIIKVKDNGIGMTEGFRQIIFEPFKRAIDDSRIKDIKGTGIGTTITKNLVDIMNGHIDVVSRLGIGSTFTVNLNLGIPEEDVPDLEEKSNEIKVMETIKKNCNALLVEDNTINAEMFIAICEYDEVKLNVDHVSCGEDALECIRGMGENGKYDIIFMDIQMPGMNGYETTVAIRNLPGAYPKNVPIVALTANAYNEDEAKAKRYGMARYLSKPIDFEKLINTLNDLL